MQEICTYPLGNVASIMFLKFLFDIKHPVYSSAFEKLEEHSSGGSRAKSSGSGSNSRSNSSYSSGSSSSSSGILILLS